jgi:hypothetical protein
MKLPMGTRGNGRLGNRVPADSRINRNATARGYSEVSLFVARSIICGGCVRNLFRFVTRRTAFPFQTTRWCWTLRYPALPSETDYR